jgi:hypothetical protein
MAEEMKAAHPDQASFNGWSLTEGREDGRFVFRWVRVP